MYYKAEERETIICYDAIDRQWSAWTTIPAHINKFMKSGWQMVRSTVSEGTVIDAEFTAPKNAITIRNLNTAKSCSKTPENEQFDDVSYDDSIIIEDEPKQAETT